MKKERNIDRNDINYIHNSLLKKECQLRGIGEIEEKIQGLLLEACNKLIPEEAKRLYKKYPFILNTARSISLRHDHFSTSREFYYKEPIIAQSDSWYSSVEIGKYFDMIPEYLRNLIISYSIQLEELESELKTEVNNIVAKIKPMTYYDLELYYPSIYKILLDRESNKKESEKKILKELERKIKETIN